MRHMQALGTQHSQFQTFKSVTFDQHKLQIHTLLFNQISFRGVYTKRENYRTHFFVDKNAKIGTGRGEN